ncbi:MAG: acyltransferase [Paludibacter sp.]|nr:acyltransferase [Paludibacter sp.]
MVKFTQQNTGYQEIKSIQILRAIAALSVAYLHTTGIGGVNLLPRAGDFGVDIFFVISGLIIAMIIPKNTNYFFIKRLFRIMPIYIIATIIMVIICNIFPEKINSTIINFPTFIKSIITARLNFIYIFILLLFNILDFKISLFQKVTHCFSSVKK